MTVDLTNEQLPPTIVAHQRAEDVVRVVKSPHQLVAVLTTKFGGAAEKKAPANGTDNPTPGKSAPALRAVQQTQLFGVVRADAGAVHPSSPEAVLSLDGGSPAGSGTGYSPTRALSALVVSGAISGVFQQRGGSQGSSTGRRTEVAHSRPPGAQRAPPLSDMLEQVSRAREELDAQGADADGGLLVRLAHIPSMRAAGGELLVPGRKSSYSKLSRSLDPPHQAASAWAAQPRAGGSNGRGSAYPDLAVTVVPLRRRKLGQI